MSMSDAEWWATSRDPQTMIAAVPDGMSFRKRQLFACACCRRILNLLPAEPIQRLIDVAERFADGEASPEEMELARVEAKQPLDFATWGWGTLEANLDHYRQELMDIEQSAMEAGTRCAAMQQTAVEILRSRPVDWVAFEAVGAEVIDIVDGLDDATERINHHSLDYRQEGFNLDTELDAWRANHRPHLLIRSDYETEHFDALTRSVFQSASDIATAVEQGSGLVIDTLERRYRWISSPAAAEFEAALTVIYACHIPTCFFAHSDWVTSCVISLGRTAHWLGWIRADEGDTVAANAEAKSASNNELGHAADLLRELLGNPLRSLRTNSEWRSDDVVRLAQEINRDKSFERMSELADKLEQAGCHNETWLRHCREPRQHVRGCWVLDQLLERA